MDGTVWVPCADEGYRRDEVVRTEGGDVVLRSGELVERDHVFRVYDGPPVPDQTQLVYLDEANVLDNLRRNYVEDQVYSYVSHILLAVNPYRTLTGIYSDEQKARYQHHTIGQLPPHPYAIADTALRYLLREQRNQAIVISGESGSGKTEMAKILMHHLAFASRQVSPHSDVQEKLIASQPILESFGNAVTARNDNSSRFGKYNQLTFGDKGELFGGGVRTFLLERARVSRQAAGERNFHVFYGLLAGHQCSIQTDKAYAILGQPRVPMVDADRERFAELKHSMDVIGITLDEQAELWDVLQALLLLGDAEFFDENEPDENDDLNTSTGHDEDEKDRKALMVDDYEITIEAAAALLGFAPHELYRSIVMRKLQAGNRESLVTVPRSKAQAHRTLTSFIMTAYTRLFAWLVDRVHQHCSLGSVAGGGAPDLDATHLGLLDIYGFERMENNSFEQLCINLTNERLQAFFVAKVLVNEQQLYAREGVPWADVEVPDSEPAVFSVKTILSRLDDICLRPAQNCTAAECEQKLVREVGRELASSGVVSLPRSTRGTARTNADAFCFRIQHYAGTVSYRVEGWLEKNNDRVQPEFEVLLRDCEDSRPIVAALARNELCTYACEKFSSVSRGFLQDLDKMVELLSSAGLHFIRCFNPNDAKQARRFDGRYVLDQVCQCGTMELVQVMHDGFPCRAPFAQIVERYADMLPESFRTLPPRQFVDSLLRALEIPPTDYSLGVTRLFMRSEHRSRVEEFSGMGFRPDEEVLAKVISENRRARFRKCVYTVISCWYMMKIIRSQRAWRYLNHWAEHTLRVVLLRRLLRPALRRLRSERGDDAAQAAPKLFSIGDRVAFAAGRGGLFTASLRVQLSDFRRLPVPSQGACQLPADPSLFASWNAEALCVWRLVDSGDSAVRGVLAAPEFDAGVPSAIQSACFLGDMELAVLVESVDGRGTVLVGELAGAEWKQCGAAHLRPGARHITAAGEWIVALGMDVEVLHAPTLRRCHQLLDASVTAWLWLREDLLAIGTAIGELYTVAWEGLPEAEVTKLLTGRPGRPHPTAVTACVALDHACFGSVDSSGYYVRWSEVPGTGWCADVEVRLGEHVEGHFVAAAAAAKTGLIFGVSNTQPYFLLYPHDETQELLYQGPLV